MKENPKYTIRSVRDGIHTPYFRGNLFKRLNGDQTTSYIWGQAISTIHEYLRENPTDDEHFQPYFFFTEKGGKKILLGRIMTFRPPNGDPLELNEIYIYHIFDDAKSILDEKFDGSFYNPEQVKVYSGSFKKILGDQFEDFSKRMNTFPR